MQQPEEGATAVEKVPGEVMAGEQVSSSPEKVAEKNYDSGSTLSGTAKEHGSKTALSLDDDAIFAHLPQHEKDILKKQLDAPVAKISFFGLYRYASRMDILILLVSAVCAIAAGAALPLFTVSFDLQSHEHFVAQRKLYPDLELTVRVTDSLRFLDHRFPGHPIEDNVLSRFLPRAHKECPVFRLPRYRRICHRLY
jgi:hypothetical protein